MSSKKKVKAKSKATPVAEKPADSTNEPQLTQEERDANFLRLLPCPGAHAIHMFAQASLQPPKLEQVFMAVAIGPSLIDVHALAAVGVMRDASLAGVELLNAFAIDDASYMALCEGIRAILMPIGFRRYEGHVNMLSKTTPLRVLESRLFYEPVQPGLRPM